MSMAAESTGRPHFHRIVLDMKTSIDFYTTIAGFFYDHGVRDLAWLTVPRLTLTLSPGEPKPEGGSYFGFALDTAEQLEARYEHLAARRQRLSGPPDMQGGSGYFFLYDPDDYPIIYSWARMDYPERSK